MKISQYADDTTLIFNGSSVSSTTALQILNLLSEISGFRLTTEKRRLCGVAKTLEMKKISIQRKVSNG